MPVCAIFLRVADHRQQGGDSDTACDEVIVGRGLESEIVSRFSDLQHVPEGDGFVEGFRATPAVGIKEHTNAVSGAVTGFSAQGVVTHQGPREQYVDMSPRLPGWEIPAVSSCKVQHRDR